LLIYVRALFKFSANRFQLTPFCNCLFWNCYFISNSSVSKCFLSILVYVSVFFHQILSILSNLFNSFVNLSLPFDIEVYLFFRLNYIFLCSCSFLAILSFFHLVIFLSVCLLSLSIFLLPRNNKIVKGGWGLEHEHRCKSCERKLPFISLTTDGELERKKLDLSEWEFKFFCVLLFWISYRLRQLFEMCLLVNPNVLSKLVVHFILWIGSTWKRYYYLFIILVKPVKRLYRNRKHLEISKLFSGWKWHCF
jgi:hypothetical protein